MKTEAPSASDIAKEAARLSEASLQEHAMHLGAIGMAGINQPIWETRAKLVRYLEEKVLTEHASIIQSAISRAVEEARKREQDFLRPGCREDGAVSKRKECSPGFHRGPFQKLLNDKPGTWLKCKHCKKVLAPVARR